MWACIAIALLAAVATYVLMPKPNVKVTTRPSEAQGPKCEEGVNIPVAFGTVAITEPLVGWYGAVKQTAVKKDGEVVAYKYYMGMQLVLCHGKVDFLNEVVVGSTSALSQGPLAGAETTYNIQVGSEEWAPVQSDSGDTARGTLRWMSGAVSTEVDEGREDLYVNAKAGITGGVMGTKGPAYHGLATVCLEDVYVGTSPNLPSFAFIVQRINTRNGGEPQWYPEKAEIKLAKGVASSWKYKVQAYDSSTDYSGAVDDSAWPAAAGGFCNESSGGGSLPPVGTVVTIPDNHVAGSKLWLRTDLGICDQDALAVDIWYSGGGVEMWFNGKRVHAHDVATGHALGIVYKSRDGVQIIPGGPNIVAIKVTNGSRWISENTYSPTSGSYVPTAASSLIYVGAAVGKPTRSPDYTEWVPIDSSFRVDMNPAHMIRECLTDVDWGAGHLDSEIDDTSFTYTADTLFNEGFGISILWDKHTTIWDFIGEILKHINGQLRQSPTTGKYELKLIRADYVVGDLPLLDSDSIERIDDVKRTSLSDLINTVVLEHTQQPTWNLDTTAPKTDADGKTILQPWRYSPTATTTVVATEPGLIQMQGSQVSTTISYPGIVSTAVAATVALRELKALSTPLQTCIISASRKAASLNIGDPFAVTWSDYGWVQLVFRVVGIDLGDGIDNKVKLTVTEDPFATPIYGVIPNNGVYWKPTRESVPEVVDTKPVTVPSENLLLPTQSGDVAHADMSVLHVGSNVLETYGSRPYYGLGTSASTTESSFQVACDWQAPNASPDGTGYAYWTVSATIRLVTPVGTPNLADWLSGPFELSLWARLSGDSSLTSLQIVGLGVSRVPYDDVSSRVAYWHQTFGGAEMFTYPVQPPASFGADAQKLTMQVPTVALSGDASDRMVVQIEVFGISQYAGPIPPTTQAIVEVLTGGYYDSTVGTPAYVPSTIAYGLLTPSQLEALGSPEGDEVIYVPLATEDPGDGGAHVMGIPGAVQYFQTGPLTGIRMAGGLTRFSVLVRAFDSSPNPEAVCQVQAVLELRDPDASTTGVVGGSSKPFSGDGVFRTIVFDAPTSVEAVPDGSVFRAGFFFGTTKPTATVTGAEIAFNRHESTYIALPFPLTSQKTGRTHTVRFTVASVSGLVDCNSAIDPFDGALNSNDYIVTGTEDILAIRVDDQYGRPIWGDGDWLHLQCTSKRALKNASTAPTGYAGLALYGARDSVFPRTNGCVDLQLDRSVSPPMWRQRGSVSS